MFDFSALLLLFVLGLVTAFGPSGAMIMFPAIGMIALLILLMLALVPLLFEALHQTFATRPTRAMIGLRWQRAQGGANWLTKRRTRRLVQRLVHHFGLTLDPGDKGETARLEALAEALVRTNLNVPSLVAAPLGRAALVALLCHGMQADAATRYRHLVLSAWPTDQVKAGLLRRLLRAIGQMRFGRGIERLRSRWTMQAVWLIMRSPALEDEEARAKEGYLDLVMVATLSHLLAKEGLPSGTRSGSSVDHLPDLRWRSLRKMIAVERIFHGSLFRVAMTFLCNPSIAFLLNEMRQKRRLHLKALSEEQKRQADLRANPPPPEPDYGARGMFSPAEIDALLEENRIPAIYLRRVWPIGTGAPGASWLGGRPNLPMHVAWPRNEQTGLPMHFLAQIDCAELPKESSPLPTDGRILFFADLDTDRTGEQEAYAVVHVPASAAVSYERAPPPDTPEVDHVGRGRHSDGNPPFMTEFPKWPVTAHPVPDFRFSEGYREKTGNPDYAQAARKATEAAIADLLPPETKRGSLDLQRRVRTAEGAQTGATGYELDLCPLGATFPYGGLFLEALGKSLLDQAQLIERKASWDLDYYTREQASTKPDRPEAEKEKIRARLEQAHGALERARGFAAGVREFAQATSQADREAAVDWLTRTARTQIHAITSAIRCALRDCIQRSVTDPDYRGLIPAEVLANLDDRLAPSLGQSKHMMLGMAQRWTNWTGSSGVRLLCLDSDYGLDFMFCDCGMVEFWIDPEDLAARRFDRVRGYTAGG